MKRKRFTQIDGIPEGYKKPIISAKQVKTVLRCELAYYYEYVEKRKVEKNESMIAGLEAHENISKNLEDKGAPISERLEKNPAFRAVYALLPKTEEPVVEKKMFFESDTHYRIVIPDILYSKSIYDLKTTRSPSALKGVYSEDVIQLHYYWETLGGDREAYILKLLLPQDGSALKSYQASLYRVNITSQVLSDIYWAEGRAMEILSGSSKPRPNPGRRCRYCQFSNICPYSVSKEGGGNG